MAAAAVYLIGFWPTWWLRDSVLRAAGFPPYAGLWKFLPHLLLYSTLQALAACVAWIAFARAGLIAGPPLGKGQRPWGKILLAGFGAVPLVLGVLIATGRGSAIHWIAPDPWSIAGNVFSNFYEEFVFRGFLLTALAAVVGFLPAAVVTSALWAATHSQSLIAADHRVRGGHPARLGRPKRTDALGAVGRAHDPGRRARFACRLRRSGWSQRRRIRSPQAG